MAIPQTTSSASGIRFGSTGYSEVRLVVPHDLVLMARVLGVAQGCFADSEIAMQVIGYELGAGARKLLGEVATYVGLALLATIGCLMIRNSLQLRSKPEFDATRGVGLLVSSLSISLDSLGVGIALPAVGIPLLPLLITVSITTTTFTFVGLAFGVRLGERYEHGAERAAGAMLVMLAALFAIERLF